MAPLPLFGDVCRILDIYRIPFEVAWVGIAFAPWYKGLWKRVTSRKVAKYLDQSYPMLALHISISMFDLGLYYTALWRTAAAPKATQLSLAICIIQSWSALYLAAGLHRLPRGDLPSIRATFQIAAIMRLLATSLALYLDSPFWHRASIKLLHSFFWTRFWLGVVARNLAGFKQFGKRYATSIVFGALMSIWESDFPNGFPIYAACFSVLLIADRLLQGPDAG